MLQKTKDLRASECPLGHTVFRRMRTVEESAFFEGFLAYQKRRILRKPRARPTTSEAADAMLVSRAASDVFPKTR